MSHIIFHIDVNSAYLSWTAVEQLKNGNEDAYKYIYDYHYVLLCHVANQYLNDNFLSETIVGDVIFHLWESRW